MLFLPLSLTVLEATDWAKEEDQNNPEERTKKVLSVFTVVKFPNSACDSSTAGRNGTCYTQSECEEKGGSSSGSCASSFGVCCVFEGTCGTTVAENNTYFSSSGRTLGNACTYRVCKCATTVCQIRLDFETFALSDPVTVTTGAVTAALTTRGQCNTDVFGVTAPGFGSVPVICGTNTGYHMYVPASDACNEISATYGSASTASTSSLAIKVSQIECNSARLAPAGCLQFFTQETGTIESFNYNSGTSVHLANQDYSSCVRQGRGQCATCYYSPTATPFGIGNSALGANGVGVNCGPTGGGLAIAGMIDYLEILGGVCTPPVPAAATITLDRYCGTPEFDCGSTSVAASTTNANTVCTNITPFKVTFKADGTEDSTTTSEGIAEGAAATDANSRGFALSYFQRSTCVSTS